MFKQNELDKLTKAKSPSLCKTNGQPDILDIIGEEVPPDYVIEKPNVLKSSEKKTSGDIFDIIESEVPPDYVDDTTNNNTHEENKSIVPAESKVSVKLQSKNVNNDPKTKYYATTNEKTKNNSDSPKENSFNLIANYGDDNQEDTGINNLFNVFFFFKF